ncbi:uncharacterized protein rp1l1b [Xiphophorus couchianus]|uniref:uncharacterized protein rp1l1b n=1 Tax=Xiphophorus couchianus TaxID=32473 RepID=UPI0010164E6B|nr:uncharacterized protein LOC114158243 [Xiphophorus couchianus]
MQKVESNAMSVKSHAAWSSYKLEEIQKVDCSEEGRGSKSAMSVNSNASTNCSSAVPDGLTEGFQACDDKEKKERTSSSLSVKSFKSTKSVKAPPPQHQPEEDVEEQAEDDSELRTQSSLSALSSVSAELKNIVQEESEEEDNQVTAEENKDNSTISRKYNRSRTPEDKTEENLEDNQVDGGTRSSLMSAASGKSILKSVSPTSRTSVRANSPLSAKSRESKTPELYDTKKADIKKNDNTEDENEQRPQSKLSVKSEKSVKSNISAKSSKLNQTKDYYCNITEISDTSEARASSVASEASSGSKSVITTEQNSCGDNGTTERAGSVMSVKSGQSHTSVVSLKSETSQVSTTHSGHLCDERNDLYATAGRSSCMSDKSIKSNISARSSNLKVSDKLNKDNVADEEQQGSSAMSAKSNVTTESTFSKASEKSNLSKQSDAVVEGTSGDHTEQRERAPSNISTSSAQSSKSHASAACIEKDASEVCSNPSDRIFNEEEGRSVSSISVQSVKSNISLKSGRTNCSTCTQAADATESFLQDSEETNSENRAENCTSTKSVESQTVRPASATSTKSKNSTKSTKSNTSNICSNKRPGEDTTEEAIPERAPSVLSVGSTKSAISIESTKSKCSTHDWQEKSSGEENDKELLQERPTSKGSHVSERSVKSAERPHSVLSEKSNVSDIESCASVEISDNRDCENATEQRAQSAQSMETVRSTTSAKSTKAPEHDELHENITNDDEMVERAASNMSARSEKSTKSNISTISKRSKVDTGCLEVVCPNERVVEGENECRSVSPLSVDSIVSTKSNKSMHSARGEEDGRLVNEEERHMVHGEERPPSSMSAKSIQSSVSEISIKSAGRTPSSLSAKSVKTSTTGACSGKCPNESNTEEAQARAESVMSSKTERSTSSAKSNKSKGLGSRGDYMVDDNGQLERSPSNLSVRSEKSTKSNASKGSKRLKVSKLCLENEAPDSEERAAGNGREDKPLSPQTVKSNTSIKSIKLKCSTDTPLAKRSDNFNSDIENDKEANIERAPSRTSTISIQSSVSEISTKSEERAASGLSEKSHASVISDLKNISEVPSEIPAPFDEVGSEDEERTSVMSVKSINSSVSDKSTKSASLDCEKHTERSSSNLSVKSGRSEKSNASKRSKVYEVDLENSADNSDVRIVEGESEGSTISMVSAQSVKSECERCDDEHENPKRPPSSTSAKSVVSHISEKSVKSANRPTSALSAKSAKSDTSAKSVKSNISDAMSGKTVESQERTNSVLSSKTAKSATSTKSSKVKKHTSPTEEDDWENEDRNPSSMSARSVTSAKSNISKVSKESKASAVTCELNAKSDNEDDCQEEHNESRSLSSMSIHSVMSDISTRSGTLKCLSDNPVQELITRSNSVISIKSNSSGVFSDTNQTGERTDNRSESAMSATEECVCGLDQVERPASSLSVNSAKSAMSNVNGTSTKSKTSNIPSDHEQEITASDIEEEGNLSSSQVTKSNDSGCSKKSRCSDVAAAQSIETPNGDNSDEKMQDRAESCTSVKTGRSHVSERRIGSKASSQANEGVDEHEKRKETASHTLTVELAKSLSTETETSVKSSGSNTDGVLAEDYVAESDSIVERAGSQVSDRSAKSKSSTKSKRSTGGDLGKENSKEESFERPLSCMSTSSVKESVEQAASTRSSKPNISRISATVSQVSDTTLNDENTNERSSSNISTNVKTSSRVTTPSDVTSVDGTSNGEGKTQRPPSTLSAKSAKSSKSSKSTKSSKLQISNKPDEEISVEDMKRPPSNSSIKSTISRHSDGGSNNSEFLAISPENVADENTDDIEIKTFSPVSAKSLKTNVSSVSTKSKASHSQKATEDQSQRSHSVLSIKSDTSSRTIQSNGSCITPGQKTGMDEDNESEAKSSKLIDPDIPKEESNPHNDENASEKSEGTQSRTSTKSRKSKNYCVPVEESSTYVEERAFSPVSTKSAKSDPSEALSRSEVPSVTIEESEDRSPTGTSSKSKASGRSKKSRTSEIHGSKSSRKSQSSLSVHSHMSAKSKKNNVTDVSTASVVSENTEESVTSSEVKEGPADKRSSKTNRSREQGKEDAGIYLNKHPVICHADSDESDLSQTLSCSDKEICETSSPGKSKSYVSDRIANGSVEATDTVSDKGGRGSKHKEKDDAGDFDLVPSILPNASPTEVVNEWLKTLPTERVLYEMEELNENSNGVKDNVVAEETDTAEKAEKNESEAENSKEVNGVDNVQNDYQTCLETPTEGNICTQREDASFNSSIQVMKVLLNPKLDRCNSLPEISPVYGRKLSTSAQGLLDCLVKLQLIDHDPKNANEKNERYQELMSILQSLWLSNPSEEEHLQNTSDHHSVEGEYNHTSSSGVDVNSGSTGSGKSSDGVKNSNNVNIDGSQPQNSLIEKTYNETDAQWKPEIEEVNQEEEDPATDETIRSNDSPREPPETPSSSNKSSGESSSNDEKLSKKLSQDSDPVWVLTLLNKIEKQFMTHYISAMKELKVRWSLGDTDQLDTMIEELKTEVHNKIQISIDREVRKIEGRVGLPRPPTEATSRTSNKQTEERRPGVKLKLQQSMDSQGEKSDSTTGTLYSDQRGENIDEYCPCETCVEQNLNSIPPLSVEVRRTAPVVTDYDLKRIPLKNTAVDCAAPCGNDDDTMTAETLVEKVIIGAIKEVEINKTQQVGEEAFEFTADEKEGDDACLDDQTTTEESVKVFATDNEEKTGTEGVERPGSESGAIHTEETASEEVTDDAITPGGESGFNVNSETAEKYTDMLSSVSEDEDEEEITAAMPVKYITASTKQFPNHANEVHDDTVAFANADVQSKEETEKDVSVEASSPTKLEASQEDAKMDWVKLRRQLLPSVQIIVHMKNKKQSMMNAKNNDTVTINEMVKDQTEEEEVEESEAETDVVQDTIILSENEPSEEIECSETENKEPAVEVSVAQTSDVKSSEEENQESFLEVGSNATLSEDEKQAMEISSVATSEHTPVAILTNHKYDIEEVRQGTSTTSDQDSAEESGGSSDEDESEDEREGTINELSSKEEEETTGDELSVTSETKLQKNQVSAVGYEGTKKPNEAESEVQASEKEEFEEDSTVDQEETISPVNSNDSPDESEAAVGESSGESDEGATTEDETDVKKQTAVTGEDETVIAASPDQSDCEEAGQVTPQEDTDAEAHKGSSTKSEDENEESETAISEHKSEKDSAEGTDTDEEKLPAVSADEFVDENRDSSTEDESSEEDNEEATTKDDISTDKEIFPAQNGESKVVTPKEEATAERTENEEVETADDEESGTASENDSAEDINGTTNDDDNAEDNEDMSSELSIEYAENQTKGEQTGEEATVKSTSVHKFEEAEEEEAVDCKEETDKVKHIHDLGLASEAEDDQEDEIDEDTTENESGKDEVEETTSRQGSDSEDETNEEKEDKLKEQSIEATDAEEEDMVKSKSDSVEGNDASSSDETSAAEAEHEINKAYNVANEKESEQTSGGEESDVSSETNPESTFEGSSKAVSENESEAEGSSSAIDDKKSANNLRAGKRETTAQEDTSTVKDDDDDDDDDNESGEEESEDEVVDTTPQECTDESESLSQAEPVEQLLLAKELESSGKMEESIEVFQEEKSQEDKTPLEESESVENESDSESKCEDCSEAVTKGQEDYKLTDEDVSEVEMIGSEITKRDSGEKSRSKDQCEEECACEGSADEAEDESGEEKEPQFTENKNATTAALNDSVKDSEKEDEDTDTAIDGWSGSLGDSADGEDEAEEDSEPGEDTADGEKPFVADKLGSLDATKKTAKKTLLIPLDALMKERAESEDGAFADIEDSETETHGQDDVTSLESKSLKKL